MNTQDVKQIYNEKVANKSLCGYEKERWFSSDIAKAAYEMILNCVNNHLLNDLGDFSTFFEVGPGAGTWTKLFLAKQPSAHFDLVDISGEMLKQARGNMGEGGNIRYFEADFLDFEAEKKYDVFFSSRALEYFPDKEKFVKKVSSLLAPGGRGFIITKAPKYLRNKILGRKISQLHQSQISFIKLYWILEECGLSDIEFYPAAMYCPVLKSALANRFIYKIFGGKKLGFLSNIFSESYAVKFKKR